MKPPTTIVCIAIDAFWPAAGHPDPGLEIFLEELERCGIPAVWVTGRSRLQLNEPRRRFGHAHPFIAESGGGIFLPVDYFHLRVERSQRLGRSVCLPIGELQPAAAEALEFVSEAAEAPVVSLRSLSPRELAQNVGLPAREAALLRQRDFEELFFFAGADLAAIERFRAEAHRRKLALREVPPLWSLSIGADLGRAVKQLSRLYDRAFHLHGVTVGIAASEADDHFLLACDRSYLLCRRSAESPVTPTSSVRVRTLLWDSPDVWTTLLTLISQRG